MASTLNAKLTQTQNTRISQPTVPAAALILASNTQPASMSDQRESLNWNNQTEWVQTKNNMAMGTLAIEPVAHRPRARVSVLGAEDEEGGGGGGGDDDDDDDDDDEAEDDSDHENAFYILVSVTSFVHWSFSYVRVCARGHSRWTLA